MEFITWLSQSFGSGNLRADLLGATAIVSGGLFLIHFLTWSAIGRRFDTASGSDAQRMSASLDTLQIELKTLAQSFAFEAIKIRQDIQFIGSSAAWKRDEAV